MTCTGPTTSLVRSTRTASTRSPPAARPPSTGKVMTTVQPSTPPKRPMNSSLAFSIHSSSTPAAAPEVTPTSAAIKMM